MPDFLTRLNGTWRFVRRVPAEFSEIDKRGIVRRSTKVRIVILLSEGSASAVVHPFAPLTGKTCKTVQSLVSSSRAFSLH
jgi:hypothetical protein